MHLGIREGCALASALMVACCGLIFRARLENGAPPPALASWGIFTVANVILLRSTLSSLRLENIISAANNLAWTVVSILLIWYLFRTGKATKEVNWFHYGCILLAAGGLALYALTNQKLLANIVFQGVMAVGYWPTYEKIVTGIRTKSGYLEPLEAWCLSFAAAAIGVIPPAIAGNRMAALYPLRSMACIALVIVLNIIGLCVLQVRKNREGPHA